MIDQVNAVYRKSGVWEKWLMVLVILGLVVAGVGLFRGILESSRVKVEYLNSAQNGNIEAKIVVDIEGAVTVPGVYELPAGSRVKDVLVMAGGLVAKSDRSYIEKTLNMAAPLKDGQKIYFPFLSDTPNVLGYSVPSNSNNVVNLNTATVAELDTLWGIGAARSESIVKNRPYQSIEEAVEKKVLTKQILEKNKDKIVVF